MPTCTVTKTGAGILRATSRPRWQCSSISATQRQISTSYLIKVAEGKARWDERAKKIRSGELSNIWDVLNERGMIKDVAGRPDRIKRLIEAKRIGAYVGIDPTGDSMHIGHLVAMMPLFWLWFHGHPACILIGGATARFGDPTGRDKTRDIMSNAQITINITKMHYQLTRLWTNVIAMRDKFNYADDWAAKRHLLNNSMWLQGVTLYDFGKRIARHTRMGPLLGRETLKRRMDSGEGFTVGEFMYPMLQAWDFFHLSMKLGIQMQIGGSDQYGNILTGIDYVRLLRETEETPCVKHEDSWLDDVVGFTTPLLTDGAGEKMGKTTGNGLWLDEYKTTPYDLYGHFVRTADDEVAKYLKLLTFMPTEKIDKLMERHTADPSKRVAQHSLAFEVVSLVHGTEVAIQEVQQHQFRFGGDGLEALPRNFNFKTPAPDSGVVTPNNRPRIDIKLPRSVLDLSPGRILIAAGLAETGVEAQRLVKNQAAYVAAQPGQTRGLVPGTLNWTPIKMWFPGETARYVIDDKLLILRKGKHNVRIIELIPDTEFSDLGYTYPGQPYTGMVRRLKTQIAEKLRLEGKPATAQVVDQSLKQLLKDRVESQSGSDIPTKSDIHEARRQRSVNRNFSRSRRSDS
ncbi:hypothetical protein CDD81_35 [Ophiocordyceps australis]|uniref:Tyrosine--tRNA ligase n=1 Tax=Ophiocordyceps australis TaxID=1399860 RepID=A0A2C5XN58_9HYPO|nr:hypothetical protein CDD81_35 [Ophiocordyceps australis]